jgi:WD40 repeat protein
LADGRESAPFGNMPFCALDVSPDGKRIATGEAADTIRLWDAVTGQDIRRLDDHSPPELGGMARYAAWVRFSVGNTVAAEWHGVAVVVWDVATGAEVRRFQPDGGIALGDVSGDGRRLAVSSATNGQITVWEIATGRLLRTLPAPAAGPNGPANHPTILALDRDGSHLLTTAGEKSIKFWDIERQQETQTAETPGVALAMSVSPDGSAVAVAIKDDADTPDVIALFDVATGKETRRLNFHGRWVFALRFSPDGKTLATGGRGQTLQFWDVTTGKEISPLVGHPGPVTTVALSPDGRLLATCSDHDPAVRMWDTQTGGEIRRLDGHPSGVEEVTISPDGKLLASAAGSVVCLWEVGTGRLVHKLEDHASLGPFLRFSDDSKSLATGSRRNQIAFWECATGKPTRELAAPPLGIAAFPAFHDGRLLVYETPNAEEQQDVSFAVWDAMANRVLRRFAGHPAGVMSVAISADGRMLASRGPDKSIRVWEVATGGERRRFNEPGEMHYTGHWTGTQFLAFSPDNCTLVTGGSDDLFARRWDIATGKQLSPFAGHRGWVGALDFSADGKVLATGSQDSTTLLWNMASGAIPPRPAIELADAEFSAFWDDLQCPDAAKAYRAILKLARGGDCVVRLIGDRLRPVAAVDPAGMARWIEDLDSAQFSVREKATSALLRIADQAEEALRSALERSRSAEARQRLRRILDVAQDIEPSPDRLRQTRAVEALEAICTPAARDQLSVLAGGAPRAALTREAGAALRRLARASAAR